MYEILKIALKSWKVVKHKGGKHGFNGLLTTAATMAIICPLPNCP